MGRRSPGVLPRAPARWRCGGCASTRPRPARAPPHLHHRASSRLCLVDARLTACVRLIRFVGRCCGVWLAAHQVVGERSLQPHCVKVSQWPAPVSLPSTTCPPCIITLMLTDCALVVGTGTSLCFELVRRARAPMKQWRSATRQMSQSDERVRRASVTSQDEPSVVEPV